MITVCFISTPAMRKNVLSLDLKVSILHSDSDSRFYKLPLQPHISNHLVCVLLILLGSENVLSEDKKVSISHFGRVNMVKK